MQNKNQPKHFVALLIATICISMLCGAFLTYTLLPKLIQIGSNNEINFSFTKHSVHTLITIYKGDQEVLKEYHAGAVTKLGLNTTFAKLTGNLTFYNISVSLLNLTFVGIGNKGTLDLDSEVLPGEWNRTAGTQHTLAYNGFNITATFHPDAGPYTADCLGLYYEAAGESLFAYDTFSEVTGIDASFTIVLEIQVSAS